MLTIEVDRSRETGEEVSRGLQDKLEWTNDGFDFWKAESDCLRANAVEAQLQIDD